MEFQIGLFNVFKRTNSNVSVVLRLIYSLRDRLMVKEIKIDSSGQKENRDSVSVKAEVLNWWEKGESQNRSQRYDSETLWLKIAVQK